MKDNTYLEAAKVVHNKELSFACLALCYVQNLPICEWEFETNSYCIKFTKLFKPVKAPESWFETREDRVMALLLMHEIINS
jgi:hypothetical protein